MASKSHDCDLTNIARSSPKMTKKQPVSNFSQSSQILSLRFERNFLQSFYTKLESFMCNSIKIVCALETKKQVALNDQEMANWELLQFFSKNVHAIERSFLQPFYTFSGSYVCNGIKIVCISKLLFDKHCKKESKNDQKTASFEIFHKFLK